MRQTGNWMSEEAFDIFGNTFKVGDEIAKAVMSGRAGNIQISIVTRMENGKIYLSGSKVPVVFPGRMVNLTAYSGRH